VELRIGSWRQRRSSERRRRTRRIERRSGQSGHHQLHPTLLSLGRGPIPSQNHRPTLDPIQLQSRRRPVLIVHGHVQENGMRGAGGHEDAASHANNLVIETAVTALVLPKH